MAPNQVRRLKELERENARLKRLVTDLSIDRSILEVVLDTINKKSLSTQDLR